MKILRPEEIVAHIKNGHTVFVSTGCAEPRTLVDALVENKESFLDVKLLGAVHVGEVRLVQQDMQNHFKVISFVPTARIASALWNRRADYIPCHAYRTPQLFTNGQYALDVALVQLSPPDRHGYCSFGISVDYTKLAAESAKLIIAEINENMPRTHGDSFIHISRIAYGLESSRDLLTVKRPPINDIGRSIGQYVSELIPCGATIQIGLGTVAEGVLNCLGDKKDLGIHSGLISDGVVDLVRKSVVNNTKKSIDQGKIVCGIVMGSRELYDFVHENPIISMKTVKYTHNIVNLTKIKNFVAINSAFEVDLSGQVNAEVLEGKNVSGIGGQSDFMRGASLSEGGKSIITLPSTDKKVSVSRIVPKLSHSVVTTHRCDVDYVVTEYGVAYLRGKNLRDRARQLISIAHPKFRDELESSVFPWRDIE